jgi:glycosyltransferase involved in cell wall biosynthesis
VDSEVLQALYQMAALIVSPLVSGTGTSVKIIEALGHGKPIIGTQVAFRGYPVESGVHCIVNDDLAEYPRLITELLPNLEKRQKLGNEARKFAEAYDYRKIYQQYAELIEVHHRNESVTSAT